MKKLFALIGVAMIGVSLNAAIISTNQTGAARTNVMLTVPSQLLQLTCVNAGTQSVTVAFFDVGSTNLTYTNGAYSNYVSSVVTRTDIWTNYYGGTNTNTYSMLTNTWSTTAAATNNYSPFMLYLVPTNTTFVYKPVAAINLGRGLLMTNSDSITVTVEYY